MKDGTVSIDAMEGGSPMHYRELNRRVRKAIDEGARHVTLKNVSGQRFIGAGITAEGTKIEIYGDAGLDTGVFSDGLGIMIHGSSEYLLGNTLNSGELVVYGDSWDVTGMGARGGRIFVMGEGGSRIGIHMKQYGESSPSIVYGGRVKQYCGEYMAGGTIVVLGLDYSDAIINKKKPVAKGNIDAKRVREYPEPVVQSSLGSGMHGGAIYVRGEVPDHLLGVCAAKDEPTEEDKKALDALLERYSDLCDTPMELLKKKPYTKVRPVSSRPFGKVYTSTPI